MSTRSRVVAFPRDVDERTNAIYWPNSAASVPRSAAVADGDGGDGGGGSAVCPLCSPDRDAVCRVCLPALARHRRLRPSSHEVQPINIL